LPEHFYTAKSLKEKVTMTMLNPGVVRTLVTPTSSSGSPWKSKFERELDAIRQKKQANAEARYGELIRQLGAQERSKEMSDEEAELAAELADQLGFEDATVEKHIQAIRDAAALAQIIAQPEPDFQAMEKAISDASNAAQAALIDRVCAVLEAAPTMECLVDAVNKICANCGWIFRQNARRLRDTTPTGPLLQAYGIAVSDLDICRQRKPGAESALRNLKISLPILFDESVAQESES
jgi:hypothetical protein